MKKRAKKRQKTTTERVKLVHKYYSRTGFYIFVWESLRRAFFPIVLVVVALLAFNKYVYNINDALEQMTETFSRIGVLTTFFISEIFLGLIPPEIFIAWTKKTANPLLNLSIIAVLSYSGGLISYFLGKATLKIDRVREYLEVKMAKNLKNTKKWGGILILIGALLPLPFSIACITAGMIKYPFKSVVGFGAFRLLRFAIYGWALFQVVN